MGSALAGDTNAIAAPLQRQQARPLREADALEADYFLVIYLPDSKGSVCPRPWE